VNTRLLASLALLSLLAMSACAAQQKPEVVTAKPEALSQPSAQQADETKIAARLSDDLGELSLVPIYFEFDSARIQPRSLAQLEKMAKHLKATPGVSITIEGHCDERGTSEYNLALGEQRARTTRDYLQTLGVAAGRIDILTLGEERPAVAGSSEEAWSKNRRAEFVRTAS